MMRSEGGDRYFAHLWPAIRLNQFVLRTVTTGYRIAFTGTSLVTSKIWWTSIPKKKGIDGQTKKSALQLMLEKKAIIKISLLADEPGFYSPIFLVQNDLGR